MNDDSVEFFVVILAELRGIRAHGVEAYHEISVDGVAFIIVESDDIGIVIVSQIVVVDR